MFAYWFKWLSVGILFATGLLFGADLLPNYAKLYSCDRCIWASFLTGVAVVQAYLLIRFVTPSRKLRLLSDTLLQVSGLALLVASCLFVVTYPPFSWAMAAFPIIGSLFVLFGRLFSLRTRIKLKTM